MDHESRVEFAFPMNDAVMGAGANEGVEHLVLIGLMGDMAEGAVDTSSGGHGNLWHGTELGRLDKLCKVGSPCQLIG